MDETIFQLNQLTYQVEGKSILHALDLQIKAGEIVTISGPSGSGKSTLLKILAMMISPTSGNLTYLGKDIDDYEPTTYRKEVSYSFQTPTLFGTTVADNLRFPYDIRQKEFNEEHCLTLLQQVGLSANYLSKTVDSLSGGEKQRISLVRNLLFKTKVLLLDEVTSALDEENRKIIRTFIKKLNQEEHVTILWVTHDTDEIALAKRILTIEAGRITEDKHA